MTNAYSIGASAPNQALKNQKLTKEGFIQRARLKHGSKYSYEKTVYISTSEKVVITCPIHGDFEQLADNHIRRAGCPKCGRERRSDATRGSAERFIKRAIAIHGGKYQYSKVEYVSNRTDVIITCPTHGDFAQRPTNHIQGKGCIHCAEKSGGWTRSGFIKKCKKNNGGLGKLYVIKCQKDKEVFYKIGITSTAMRERFRGTHAMPYEYKTTYLITGNPNYIYDLENKLQALMIEHNYSPLKPFSGQTECFTTIKPIEQLLKRLTSTEQLQLIA